ncbi:SUMO-activating enzyme subunit 1 [Trichonephila inaurata madagascariensis]|uniref:SUMO-activating enzyme subunit 1 n=1 Tax=Trichonephila inaurata madagascariensis TaxID=2747483 RepID=A0A8X7BPZ7_9ARAC|nr:SUMO-activating enzyme subunit 1 [Trichonephila inaurata madagascariensis]
MGIKRDREIAGMSNDHESYTITDDEVALYDRQIRLWGFDCQKRLRDSKILVIGLNGLGAEVVKNLALSGVKSITIMDETPVPVAFSCSQFFISGCEINQGRAMASKAAIQELNPNVEIIIDSEHVTSKAACFYAGFNAVFATDCPLSILIRVNKLCTLKNIPFYCGDTWGFYGYGFLDLLKHNYSRVHITKKEQETLVNINLDYCPLGPALGVKIGAGLNRKINKVYLLMNVMNNFREMNNRCLNPENREAEIEELKSVRNFTLQNLGCQENKVSDEMLGCVFGELSPVCAVVGGVMANEIIKGITRRGDPIHNFFLFDGETCTGATEAIIV